MNKAKFLQHFHLFSLAAPRKDQQKFSCSSTLLPSQHKPIKQAAVLIALFEQHHELQVLFTLRASHLKHHAGQVSFPGGKVEEGDHSHITTALREAQEEIGLVPNEVAILGQLHPYHTLTGFEVTPIIGLIQPPNHFIIDDNEVAEVFWAPLSYFLNQNHHFTIQSQINGKPHPVTFMPYQHYNIWGATAAILKDLAKHIRA